MNGIKVILFDLDDTLYDFAASWEIAMKETMRKHPLTADLETEALYSRFEYYSHCLWSMQEEKKVTFNQYRRLRLSNTLKDFGREIDNDVSDDFNELFFSKSLEAIKPSDIVIKLLETLSHECRLGIITNGPADISYKKVIRLGIDHLIPENAVFVSEVVGYTKPDRRIFDKALQHFGINPTEAMFVGDNWKADITGALDAGLSAVWINRHKTKPTTDHQPLAEITKLEDLVYLLSLN
jgi:HAD superfamily hydrolase (TIGR01549 family)